jgi:SAM-dependent methyltransferase
MGWDDCFDFIHNEFIRADMKAPEIYRVLRQGGRFVCASWEVQEDLAWMEETILRYHPGFLVDQEYLERRPIGMSYEKPSGYEIILRTAGFHDIQFAGESAEFVSTDEEEWWQMMASVGWQSLFNRIEIAGYDQLERIKEAIFIDLQRFKQPDGIHFTKRVFFISAVK